MATLIDCIECGKAVSSAISECPQCGGQIHGVACVVCQRIGKKTDLKEVRSHYAGRKLHIHPACLLQVTQERDAPMYTCPLCQHTVRAAFVSQCANCGHPVGQRLSSECEYCEEYVVHAYGHPVKREDTRFLLRNKYAHRACYQARKPVIAWFSRLFQR